MNNNCSVDENMGEALKDKNGANEAAVKDIDNEAAVKDIDLEGVPVDKGWAWVLLSGKMLLSS